MSERVCVNGAMCCENIIYSFHSNLINWKLMERVYEWYSAGALVDMLWLITLHGVTLNEQSKNEPRRLSSGRALRVVRFMAICTDIVTL